MQFTNSISGILKLPINEVINDYKISVVGDKLVSITNFVRVQYYDDRIVKIKIKNNCIIIQGNNLIVYEISNKEITIKGKVLSISLEKVL